MRLSALRRWSLCLLLICLLFPNEGVRGAQPASDEPVASMSTPRYRHTATRLLDGRVLVVGGGADSNGFALVPTAELYDSATNAWHAAGSMVESRIDHSATLLADGRVLVAGGRFDHTSAELFDPVTGSWTATGAPNRFRLHHPTALLANGTVLIAGGSESIAIANVSQSDYLSQDCTGTNIGADNSAEIYDPAVGRWNLLPSMSVRRASHTLTALPDGSALAIGGGCASAPASYSSTFLASVERYDPGTRQWQSMPPMSRPRAGHTATLLADGRVLVMGGHAGGNVADNSAEIFDPQTMAWTTAGTLQVGRAGHRAVALPDGRIFVTNGASSFSEQYVAAELYDPLTGHSTLVGSLHNTSDPAPVTLLADGRVLFARGTGVRGGGGAAEIFDPALNRWRESEADTRARTCFPTGYCVRGPMQEFWQGIMKMPIDKTGYPISDEFTEVLEDGKQHTVQYFERARIEYHPEIVGNIYNVFLLGQFGRRLHPADPPVSPLPDARYFPETGHNVQGQFLDYWTRGQLFWYGYPLTEEFEEVLEDGKTYRVQYFERARFEYHPENAPPYDILLGHFGRRILAEAQPLP